MTGPPEQYVKVFARYTVQAPRRVLLRALLSRRATFDMPPGVLIGHLPVRVHRAAIDRPRPYLVGPDGEPLAEVPPPAPPPAENPR